MRRDVQRTMVKDLLAFIFLGTLIACASPTKPPTPTPPPAEKKQARPEPRIASKVPAAKKHFRSKQRAEFYVHEVRWEGECISLIAEWYTGIHTNWGRIAKANSDFDPKRMKIGDKILIPVSLLNTRKPMPRKYLGTSVNKKDTPISSREKPAKESDSDRTEVVEKRGTGRQTLEINEIELYQPTDAEQTATELGEVELFQPLQ